MHLKREMILLVGVGLLFGLLRESRAASLSPAMEQCICAAVQAILNPQKNGATTTLRGPSGNGLTKGDVDNFKNAVNNCINANGGNSTTKYEDVFECDIVYPDGSMASFQIHLERGDKGKDANVTDPPGSGVDITVAIGGEGSTGNPGGNGNATNQTPGGAAVGAGGDGRNNPTGSSGATAGGSGSATTNGGTAASGGGNGGHDRDHGADGGNGTSSSGTGDARAFGGTGGDPAQEPNTGGNGGSAAANSGPPPGQNGNSGGGGMGTHGSGASATEGPQGTGSTNSNSVPNQP